MPTPYYTREIKRFGGALIELSDGNPLSLTSREITLHMLRYSQPDIDLDLQLICYNSQSQVWLLTCTDSNTKTPRVAIQSKQPTKLRPYPHALYCVSLENLLLAHYEKLPVTLAIQSLSRTGAALAYYASEVRAEWY